MADVDEPKKGGLPLYLSSRKLDADLKKAGIRRNVRFVAKVIFRVCKLSIFILVFALLLRVQIDQFIPIAWFRALFFLWALVLLLFIPLKLFLDWRAEKFRDKEIFFHRMFSPDLGHVLSEFEAIVDETWTEEKLRSRKQEIVEWRPRTLKVPDEERQKEIERRVWILNPPEGTKSLEEHPLNEEFLRIEERLNDSYILFRMKKEILDLPEDEQESLLRFFVLREVRSKDLRTKERARVGDV